MINHFPRIAAGLPDACESGVRQVAVEIAVEAAQRAPVDTGALRATCRAEPLSRGDVVDGVTIGGAAWAALAGDVDSTGLRPDGRTVDYAIYQEFGTHKMAAQPFFFPAVESLRGDFPAIIETALSARINALGHGGALFPGAATIDLNGYNQ